jgi:uncharacterized membrane-anchored protein
MRKKLTHALLAFVACLFAAPAFADGLGDAGPDVAQPPVHAGPVNGEAPAAGRNGEISLMNGEFTLTVPSGWTFYPAEEAQAFLQRTSATAPSGTAVGLLAKANVNPREPGTWATVVSYDPIGYVQPETSSGLADANFEATVRSARASQNRAFEGFASAPAFDATAPDLTWAERSAAPGTAGAADLRVEQKELGRYGVASLTSIGTADQMPEIMAAAGDMKRMLRFADGRKASDFQPAVDHVSAYSVPGLVTGVPNAQPQAVADTSAGQTQTGFGGFPIYGWVAVGVAALAGLGFIFMRRRKPDEDEPV